MFAQCNHHRMKIKTLYHAESGQKSDFLKRNQPILTSVSLLYAELGKRNAQLFCNAVSATAVVILYNFPYALVPLFSDIARLISDILTCT